MSETVAVSKHLIARHAGSALWLARYMERIENLARLLDVTKTFAGDAEGGRNWLSLLRINGDEAAFFAKHAAPEATSVAHFYLLDTDNPTSVQTSIRYARENARTLRALISTEMWLQINVFHGRICALSAADIAPEELSGVCAMLKEGVQSHTGITEGTFYRDQCWHFYMMGRHLERADQITRLIDTKFNALLPSAATDAVIDAGEWNALLRAAAGYHAYRREYPHGYVPREVAGFLLLNGAFPRSAEAESGAARLAPDAAAQPLPSARLRAGAGAAGPSADDAGEPDGGRHPGPRAVAVPRLDAERARRACTSDIMTQPLRRLILAPAPLHCERATAISIASAPARRRSHALAMRRDAAWEDPMSLSPTSTGIGQPVRRREDLRLLTGRGRYSDDINVPGQAYAVMVRSPHAHARIRAIDTQPATARARRACGVDRARSAGRRTEADPACGAHRHIRPTSSSRTRTARRRSFRRIIRWPPTRCAMSATSSRWWSPTASPRRRTPPNCVVVDYEELPAVVHSRASGGRGRAAAPGRMPHRISASMPRSAMPRATDAAFAAAAHVVRLSTSVQRIAGVTMEPRAAIGEYDAATGHYTLHAGAGGAVRPRHDMAVVLGVADEDVRMVMHDVGGNFGTRGASNPEFALVAWAARRVGRAVKWTCERSEAFLCDYQARDLTADAELALDAQGTFLAMRGTNIVNSGAYPVSFGPLHKGVEIMTSIYHVPVVHFRACATLTNTAPTRPYRSSGRPEAMFVMERLIDLAARQCGFDRIELRRRNLVPEAAMPYRNPFGLEYDSGDYHAVMERVLALGDWTGFAARRAEAKRRGKCRGIGVANYVDTATGVPRERAEITVQPEGVVEVVIGTVSSGQGHETSFAQLVSEWLGVPIDSVALVQGDTARVSVGGGSHSGRALRLGSIVMLGASNEIIEKGMRIAEPRAGSGGRRSGILRRPLHREGHRPLDRHLRGRRRGRAAQRPAGRSAQPGRRRRRDGEPRGISLWLPRLRGGGRSGDRRGGDRALRGGR